MVITPIFPQALESMVASPDMRLQHRTEWSLSAPQTAQDAPDGQNLQGGNGFHRFFKPKPKGITEFLHIPVPAGSHTQDELVTTQAELRRAGDTSKPLLKVWLCFLFSIRVKKFIFLVYFYVE